MAYKNGDVYTGEYKNDLMHGYGIYLYSNGNCYKGYWEKATCHGEGE